MKKAVFTTKQKLYFLLGSTFFLLFVAFALYLFYSGIRSRNWFEVAISGVFLYFFAPCGLGYLKFLRLPDLGIDESHFWLGDQKIPLNAIRAAAVEPWGPCALARENAPTPFLVLQLKSGEVLAVPLVHKGWDEVYEALRQQKPELSLLPWQEDPVLSHSVQNHLNSGVHLPRGVRVVRERVGLALLAAVAVFFLSAEIGRRFSLPSFLLSPLPVLAYFLIARTRLEFEPKER